MVWPAEVMLPLKVTIVDAETGAPIEGADVLRIACDVHDRSCARGILDVRQSDENGHVDLEGERKWRVIIAAAGGVPLPNHKIAIWKSGFEAFVFSQYDSIDSLASRSNREDIKAALKEIPSERRVYGQELDPSTVFAGGTIRLYRAQQ
jgi:hypothetical protein